MTRIPVDREVLDSVRNFYAAGLNFRAHIEWANQAHGGGYKVPVLLGDCHAFVLTTRKTCGSPSLPISSHLVWLQTGCVPLLF